MLCCRMSSLSSRYPRYEGGDPRRSRSRSPDRSERYDRMPPYGNEDRRRSSAIDQRGGGPPFQSMRSDISRDVPRGPKALQPPDSLPNAPRGGYGGDFSRGRGRPRGGRGWLRDDSRERGRDMDFRDRNTYRGEERSRDRERDRDRLDRDRDWREHHERTFRNRRPSPPTRGRSPPGRAPFHDRESQLSLNLDRARGARDGGPPSAGSATSDSQFGPPSYSSQRGGFNSRGRGRGGRGDWDNRPRGRYFNDDHRFNRSRSQEGRWNNRDRDRDDRFPDFRDRDDRDFREREPVRPRLDRPIHSHDNSPINPKETTSPPPLTPGAGLPHFVPRNPRGTDGNRSSLPHPPKTLPERPGSAGHGSVSDISMASGSPTLPPGPKNSRGFATSGWGNPVPASKKIPESPGARLPPRPFPGSYPAGDDRRPRSSDAKSDTPSYEPSYSRTTDSVDSRSLATDLNLTSPTTIAPTSMPASRDIKPTITSGSSVSTYTALTPTVEELPRIIRAPVVRFQLPPTEPPPPPPIFEAEAGSIEDEDEDPDIGDYVTDEITKAEASMRGLTNQEALWEVIRLFSYLSHEALHEIVTYEPDLPYLHTHVPEKVPDIIEDTNSTAEKSVLAQNMPKAETKIPIHANDRAKNSFTPFQQTISTDDGEAKALIPMSPNVMKAVANNASKDSQNTRMKEANEAASKSLPSLAQVQTHTDKDQVMENKSIFEKSVDVPKTSGTLPEENTDFEMTVDSPKSNTVEKSSSDSKPTISVAPVPTFSSTGLVVSQPLPLEDESRPASVSSTPAPAQTPVLVPVLHTGSLSSLVDNSVSMPSRPEPISIASGPLGAELKLTPPAESVDGNETETEPDMEIDGVIDGADTGTASTPSTKMGMKTPPLDSLPDFNVTVPWFEDELVLDSLKEDPNSTKYVFQHLSKQEAGVCSSMQDASLEFRDRLINYFDFTRSEDPAAIRSRGKFSINGGLDDSEPSSSGSSRKPEGRTRRFASERDLQRILAASIKEDEERKERAEQLKKDQCRNDEKEAVVPDMIWGHERRENMRFLDNSGFIPVRDTVAIWQCLPPIPNFTDMESDLFVKAYLERPKQWGMIAEAIPKRDFRSCIQYYYIKKRELDLKTKLKKQPRRRRKAVKKAKTAPLQDDAENDENQDTNENGERRRPRRAAAPTFGEQAKQAAEEKARAEGAVASEKTDVRRKRKTAKEREKEKEQQREAKAASKAGTSTPQPQVQPDQTEGQSGSSTAQLDPFSVPSTPAPPTPVLGTTKNSGKAARSRSSSHAHHNEARASAPGTPQAHALGIERTSATPAPVHTPIPLPTVPLQQPPPQSSFPASTPTVMTPVVPSTSFSASVSLRPTPPPPNFTAVGTTSTSASGRTPIDTPGGTPQPQVQPLASVPPTAANSTAQTSAPSSSTANERRQGNQPSSYWSVPEMEAFPGLLAHFGTDWSAMATFMTSKTPTMVKNMYARDKDKSGRKTHWEAIARKADEQRANGEPRPDPPAIQLTARRSGPRGGGASGSIGVASASASTTASAAGSPVVPNAPGIGTPSLGTPKLSQPEPPTAEPSPAPSPVKEPAALMPSYASSGPGRPIVPIPLAPKMTSSQPATSGPSAQPTRPEPTGLARPPAELPRSSAPSSSNPTPGPGPNVYASHQQPQMRNILRESANTSPPIVGVSTSGPSRPVSTLSQRPSDAYVNSPKPTPVPAKKTSSLMSLLNDDGPLSPPKPAPVATAVAGSSLRPQSHSPAPQTVSSRNSMAPPSSGSAPYLDSPQ
ncbi:hypothetical protein CFIMG_005850RA [Ceratocystis fimbriata CBS 114723]|uniref:Myb-like domain-containing protein n=1 Tax=Ceratocystis fimbriata CBS 114723 TaxID=1035309 RepID=A0A2C5WYI7_9PEZI|nr:hypothetical protein CFIMG_005850RA [Ceratocystis fimbriata CBS 114723]